MRYILTKSKAGLAHYTYTHIYVCRYYNIIYIITKCHENKTISKKVEQIQVQVQFTVILNTAAIIDYKIMKSQVMRNEKHWFSHPLSQYFCRFFKFS